MENKIKIITTISILLLAVLVSAGLVLNDSKNAEIQPQEKSYTSDTEKNITFMCDETPMSVISQEPDGNWDEGDVVYSISSVRNKVATEISMDDLIYKELADGSKAFQPEFIEEDLEELYG